MGLLLAGERDNTLKKSLYASLAVQAFVMAWTATHMDESVASLPSGEVAVKGDVGGIQQEAMPAVGNYLDFIMHFMLAFGIAALLPILLMLLERAGIVSLEQLTSVRRYMIVAAFGVAAVATPPDIVSMLLLAVPLCLLYEISLVAIRITRRRRTRA
jgi:hypothetical protein